MLPVKLLWDSLPDPLPATSSTSFSGLRKRLEMLFGMAAESRLPLDELVRLRVRRGIVQCLVRDAYQATLADQDREHRRPREFAEAWRANLAFALDRADVDLSGSGPEALTADDVNLAWKLYKAASRGREEALGHVKLKHSQLTRMGSLKVPIFEITVTSEGEELGAAKYGTCYPCGVGLLQKISFDPDWQFCGLGRLTLSALEARHPSLTWYTTAQFKDARGFYERYRQNSSSPWIDKQHLCLHFD